MTVPNTKRLGIRKYQQEKCDRITADVPKGKRDAYKLIAAEVGISLAQLIQDAVEEYGRKHAGENFLDKHQTRKLLSPAEEKLLAEFSKLPPDAKKHLVELAKIINQKGGVQND